jgi:hypothetical protein
MEWPRMAALALRFGDRIQRSVDLAQAVRENVYTRGLSGFVARAIRYEL